MYEPEVNDYVEWTTKLGQVHEGWVYFKADKCIQKRGWYCACLSAESSDIKNRVR